MQWSRAADARWDRPRWSGWCPARRDYRGSRSPVRALARKEAGRRRPPAHYASYLYASYLSSPQRRGLGYPHRLATPQLPFISLNFIDKKWFAHFSSRFSQVDFLKSPARQRGRSYNLPPLGNARKRATSRRFAASYRVTRRVRHWRLRAGRGSGEALLPADLPYHHSATVID